MTDTITTSTQITLALDDITHGMAFHKCRKCGCMAQALTDAETTFSQSGDLAMQALLPSIFGYKAQLEPIAYDCLGCHNCFGADATVAIASHFDALVSTSCCCTPGSNTSTPCDDTAQQLWPPVPGEYLVGNAAGSVAVCTLSSRDLAEAIVATGQNAVAIAGRCDTENIGVEKVVLNLIANPAIRTLILCGEEARGHRTGDAFIQLKHRGVDADMRVLESAAWHPVLANLSVMDVARFRAQVELVTMIGVTDIETILAAVREAASHPKVDLPAYDAVGANFERIPAHAPQHLTLDPAGFFIVLPNPISGTIVCEHYSNDGRLLHVIEGRQSAEIAATTVEHGLVTRLDHAAYLGRELAKAELSLKTGVHYEQDAALGELPPKESDADVIQSAGCVARCAPNPSRPFPKIL